MTMFIISCNAIDNNDSDVYPLLKNFNDFWEWETIGITENINSLDDDKAQ